MFWEDFHQETVSEAVITCKSVDEVLKGCVIIPFALKWIFVNAMLTHLFSDIIAAI